MFNVTLILIFSRNSCSYLTDATGPDHVLQWYYLTCGDAPINATNLSNRPALACERGDPHLKRAVLPSSGAF